MLSKIMDEIVIWTRLGEVTPVTSAQKQVLCAPNTHRNREWRGHRGVSSPLTRVNGVWIYM